VAGAEEKYRSGRKILLADKLDERHDDIYDICPLVNAKSVAVWFL
jgi:hypothetical protein